MPFYETITGWYGGLSRWWGRTPGTATPVDAPKAKATPQLGTADTGVTGQTGGSIAAMSNPGSLAGVGEGWYPGYGLRRNVTIELILAALADPIISACHRYVTEPIRTGKANLVASDEAPKGAKEWIEKVTKPLLPRYLEDAMWAVPFGWVGWQRVWERVDGDYVVTRLLMGRHEWSGVLYDQDSGEYVGLKWDGTDIFGLKALLYTYDRRGSKDYLGRSRIENVIEVYDNWREANNQTAKLSNKASGTVLKMGYPPGASAETTNKDRAETFAKRATSGAGWVTYPTWGGFTVEQLMRMTPDQIVAFSKATDWPMDALDLGEQGSAISALTGDKQYLDQLKCLGYGVPPQAILSATTSNRATAEAAGGYGTDMNESVNQGVYACFNQVVDDLMELKFGKQTRGTVRWEPEPLSDPQAVIDNAMLQAAMSSSNPDVQRDVGERDWNAVYIRNGVPKLPEAEIAKRKQEKEDAAAKAMQDQQALAAAKGGINGEKPGANGNGRMVGAGAKDEN